MPSSTGRRSHRYTLAMTTTAVSSSQCVRQALAGDDSIVGPALNLLWVSRHLDNLWRLGVQLIQPAAELSSKGAHPRDRALRGVLRPHPS